MPHYRDGSAAKVGDLVIGSDWEGRTVVGEVQSIHAGSVTCNMTVAYVRPAPQATVGTFTCSEFEKIAAPADAPA